MAELVTPNYSETQDPLEPGEYYARITKCEKKTGKTSGAAYLNWTLNTFNEEDAKNNDRMFWHITMLEGKGAGMLKTFYKAATGKDQEGALDWDELMGKEVKAVLYTDDQGYTKVKAITAIQ